MHIFDWPYNDIITLFCFRYIRDGVQLTPIDSTNSTILICMERFRYHFLLLFMLKRGDYFIVRFVSDVLYHTLKYSTTRKTYWIVNTMALIYLVFNCICEE